MARSLLNLAASGPRPWVSLRRRGTHEIDGCSMHIASEAATHKSGNSGSATTRKDVPRLSCTDPLPSRRTSFRQKEISQGTPRARATVLETPGEDDVSVKTGVTRRDLRKGYGLAHPASIQGHGSLVATKKGGGHGHRPCLVRLKPDTTQSAIPNSIANRQSPIDNRIPAHSISSLVNASSGSTKYSISRSSSSSSGVGGGGGGGSSGGMCTCR
jgi:hypothetical protein